jgi:hypothetical protein
VTICATGFDISFRPYSPVIGQGGVHLADHWSSDPEAYLAMAASRFPNFLSECGLLYPYWCMSNSSKMLTVGSLGPNCPAGHGSFIAVLEAAQSYICKVIRKVQTENIKSICVRPSAVAEYNEHVHEWQKRT